MTDNINNTETTGIEDLTRLLTEHDQRQQNAPVVNDINTIPQTSGMEDLELLEKTQSSRQYPEAATQLKEADEVNPFGSASNFYGNIAKGSQKGNLEHDVRQVMGMSALTGSTPEQMQKAIIEKYPQYQPIVRPVSQEEKENARGLNRLAADYEYGILDTKTGQMVSLNKVGLSGNDIVNTGLSELIYILATPFTGGAGWIIRGLKAAGVMGAANLAQQTGRVGFGGADTVDPGEIAWTSLGSAAPDVAIGGAGDIMRSFGFDPAPHVNKFFTGLSKQFTGARKSISEIIGIKIGEDAPLVNTLRDAYNAIPFTEGQKKGTGSKEIKKEAQLRIEHPKEFVKLDEEVAEKIDDYGKTMTKTEIKSPLRNSDNQNGPVFESSIPSPDNPDLDSTASTNVTDLSLRTAGQMENIAINNKKKVIQKEINELYDTASGSDLFSSGFKKDAGDRIFNTIRDSLRYRTKQKIILDDNDPLLKQIKGQIGLLNGRTVNGKRVPAELGDFDEVNKGLNQLIEVASKNANRANDARILISFKKEFDSYFDELAGKEYEELFPPSSDKFKINTDNMKDGPVKDFINKFNEYRTKLDKLSDDIKTVSDDKVEKLKKDRSDVRKEFRAYINGISDDVIKEASEINKIYKDEFNNFIKSARLGQVEFYQEARRNYHEFAKIFNDKNINKLGKIMIETDSPERVMEHIIGLSDTGSSKMSSSMIQALRAVDDKNVNAYIADKLKENGVYSIDSLKEMGTERQSDILEKIGVDSINSLKIMTNENSTPALDAVKLAVLGRVFTHASKGKFDFKAPQKIQDTYDLMFNAKSESAMKELFSSDELEQIKGIVDKLGAVPADQKESIGSMLFGFLTKIPFVAGLADLAVKTYGKSEARKIVAEALNQPSWGDTISNRLAIVGGQMTGQEIYDNLVDENE